VQHIKYVDLVIPQYSMNKMDAWNKINFNIMFVGDDWHGTDKWELIEKELKEVGVRMMYFPYTQSTSSTLINQILLDERDKMN